MKNIKSSILFTFLILASCGEKKEKSVEDIIETNNLQIIERKTSRIDLKQEEIHDSNKSN